MRNLLERIKTLAIVIISVAALLFITVQCEAQSNSIAFYFEASASMTTQQHAEELATLRSNLVIDSIVGMANTLPNYSGISNTDLAYNRAVNIGLTIEDMFGVDYYPQATVVVRGTSANERKVVVYYHYAEESVSYVFSDSSVAELDTISDIDFAELQVEDSVSVSDTTFSFTQFPMPFAGLVIVDANGIVGVLVDSMDCISFDVDTLSAYEEAVFAMPLPQINSSPSCGCGVNNSLELTWELYKSYQDSASLFTHVDNDSRNKYTALATYTRNCWEKMYAQYKRQLKDEAPLACGTNPLAVKSSLKVEAQARAKAKSKSKRSRRPRKSWRPNDNFWSKLLPFRGC